MKIVRFKYFGFKHYICRVVPWYPKGTGSRTPTAPQPTAGSIVVPSNERIAAPRACEHVASRAERDGADEPAPASRWEQNLSADGPGRLHRQRQSQDHAALLVLRVEREAPGHGARASLRGGKRPELRRSPLEPGERDRPSRHLEFRPGEHVTPVNRAVMHL